MMWFTLCTLFCLFLHTSNSLYLPSVINEDEQENIINEELYQSCPKCFERINNIDNSKRLMSTWARSGMPLSILYLKTKPNQQKEEILNSPLAPLAYRQSPSTRGFHSKLFQAASLMKTNPNLGVQNKNIQNQSPQTMSSGGLPIRRQSVVLPQLFVTYGFENKKTMID